jgi:hypothetical protein
VSTATHITDDNTLAMEDVAVNDVAHIRQSDGKLTPETTTPGTAADCGCISADVPLVNSCFATGRNALADGADAAVSKKPNLSYVATYALWCCSCA